MIEHVPELIEAGIDSFKIEGRMKTTLYVAVVARTYRQAVDDYLESPEKYKENLEHYKEEISKCTYRQFTTGFFFGPTNHESQIYDNNTYVKGYTYLGSIEKVENGRAMFEQRNKFCVGDSIEIMKPDGSNIDVKVDKMWDEEGNEIENCPHPQVKVWIQVDAKLEPYDILRQENEGDMQE
jgi:putative protease